MKTEYRISNHTVQIWETILNENGSPTGDWHIRKTIGPDDDISAESEEIKAYCTAARIGYVKPE